MPTGPQEPQRPAETIGKPGRVPRVSSARLIESNRENDAELDAEYEALIAEMNKGQRG
jgi:hypothetical protein